MGARTLSVAAAVLAVLSLAGCTGSPAASPAQPVDGLVVSVVGDGAAGTRFTLQTNDGSMVSFVVGALMHPLPLNHLVDHEARRAPVRVYYRSRDGELIAYDIVDAENP